MNYLHIYKIIGFTFSQALISTFLGLIISLILLKTFSKLHGFLGKLIKSLISLPFYVPTLIGCLCIIILFGRSGIISKFFKLSGIKYTIYIYSIIGIIITQIFYYIPLFLKNLDRCLDTMPRNYRNMKDLFNISQLEYFKNVTFYFLKNEILASSFLVFLYTLHCFSIALIFGGNPNSTTLEMHIYKLMNFDFHYRSAVLVCLFLFIFSLPIHYLYYRFRNTDLKFINSKNFTNIPAKLSIYDYFILFVCVCFFFIPLLVIISFGFKNIYIFKIIKDPEVIKSLINTLTIGFFSSILCLISVFFFMDITFKFQKRYYISYLINLLVNVPIIMSPSMFGMVSLIFFKNFINSIIYSYMFLIILFTVLIIPIIYRILYSPFAIHCSNYNSLCSSLGINTYKKYRNVIFPLMKKNIGFAISSIFILSIGDLKSILIISNARISTLPLIMFDKMNGYNFSYALSIAAFILILISMILLFFEKVFD